MRIIPETVSVSGMIELYVLRFLEVKRLRENVQPDLVELRLIGGLPMWRQNKVDGRD
ncbi:hypothetical protein [Fimbriimonas ginsengisoli]|uniref:Uncharacterized protein n=1 Tax=Fimbriimonas ginsengisoli Gsoil 348 TaxID=661478 RepID=A0A068NVR9_FIMGI|nr:hypothetical protein [Fimbriimonas ginsengisoli]AIE87593.1 hypothetical protein OP10G_4225 [Fimbriimonas ginsengisoli Gsoil 348]